MNAKNLKNSESSGRSKKKKPQAIHSYGVILYAYIHGDIHFLLYKRRDNFEYMDFVRGLWNSKSQLPSLFSLMNADERDRIRNYTFKELWDDLWVEHNSRIYRDGQDRARKKYNSVYDYIPTLLKKTNSQISSTPWGFPKGKKNNSKEKSVVCAKREFSEETCIPYSKIRITNNVPFSERFTGSNRKVYATNYYLAYMDTFDAVQYFPQRRTTPWCIRDDTVSEEASDVRWFTFQDACRRVSPQRQAILKEIMEIIPPTDSAVVLDNVEEPPALADGC